MRKLSFLDNPEYLWRHFHQGEIAGKLASVPFMLQLGATVEQIAKALDLPLEKVQEVVIRLD